LVYPQRGRTDMHRWPSGETLLSWLGLCPQHKISGGQVLSRRVRPGAHRVTIALRLAARQFTTAHRVPLALFPAHEGTDGDPQSQ